MQQKACCLCNLTWRIVAVSLAGLVQCLLNLLLGDLVNSDILLVLDCTSNAVKVGRTESGFLRASPFTDENVPIEGIFGAEGKFQSLLESEVGVAF